MSTDKGDSVVAHHVHSSESCNLARLSGPCASSASAANADESSYL